MRSVMAIVIAALTPGLIYGVGQAGPTSPTPCIMFRGACDVPSLELIHLVDAQTGWTVTRGSAELLRTMDGGVSWRDVTPVESTGKRVAIWRINVLSSLIVWVMPSGSVG